MKKQRQYCSHIWDVLIKLKPHSQSLLYLMHLFLFSTNDKVYIQHTDYVLGQTEPKPSTARL